MTYNSFLELAAILLLIVVLYDYKNKMKIYRLDARLFQLVIYVSLLESIVNLFSSFLVAHTKTVPLWFNIAAAVLFFVLQATKIYALTGFSFAYMNRHFSRRSPEFYIITATYAVNMLLAITTPFTRFYFYFDEQRRYVQGFGADLGYYFYLINVVICLIYVLVNRKHLIIKDMKVAGVVAAFVGAGVLYQFISRSTLTIGFGCAMAVLYLYMTLENPNDYQDRLTHCANEYGIKIHIEEKCRQQRIFSVLYFDLKKYRYVNSIFGMEMGDHLLQSFAEFLERTFRKSVVVRVHNDLFAVVMNGPQEESGELVSKVLNRCKTPWKLPDGREAKLDVVAVLCEYPKYFRTHSELIRLRTDMLGRIKETHGQSVLYANQEIAEKCQKRERIEEILNTAMEQHTLQVYYQPIMNSDTGEIVALEALSRLEDPEFGFIPPDEFIAVAETTGQILQLGFYVLEETCSFVEEYLLPNPRNTVSCVQVNLSSLQCVYLNLTKRFREIVDRHQIPFEMIHFELTESTMLESPQMVHETMERLISMGMKFALDDYGTGYSNVSYLIRFPFDKIKFDKNLVWSYFDKKEARLIMQNEFQILCKLGKEIIVEGIETEEQYLEMKSQGIHLFQGYYFSKALPKEKCAKYLADLQKKAGSE